MTPNDPQARQEPTLDSIAPTGVSRLDTGDDARAERGTFSFFRYLAAQRPMLAAIDAWTLGWLLAGGLSYTLGTVFYHRPQMRYSHAIWHLFVLAGSVCHYIAVVLYVV